MRHIICSFLFVSRLPRGVSTPHPGGLIIARARDVNTRSQQPTMMMIIIFICHCCTARTLVVLALRCKFGLTKFRLFWLILFRSSHRFCGCRSSPCRYPVQSEEDHGGQDTSHGQHLVIDGLPNAVLGSTSKFSKRLARFSFRD